MDYVIYSFAAPVESEAALKGMTAEEIINLPGGRELLQVVPYDMLDAAGMNVSAAFRRAFKNAKS